MIREIVLIDFMSHRHTVIEPAAGLTVLVGPNNCGKSAIVAALQILSANSTKHHMIRHGCRECSVTVETDDGHTITWRRKGKVVNYTIDGQDVHRLEGGVPEGLHAVLKLAPVESVEGGETFDVHFARQKEPIFLLNGTGKQAATFFASSSDASRLVAMQQRHREKVREHGQSEKIVAKQVDELKLQLGTLASVPDLHRAVEEAVGDHERLLNQAKHIEELQRRIRLLEEQCFAVDFAQARCRATASLMPPPVLSDTRVLELLIGGMTTAGAQIVSVGADRDVLLQLCPPPELMEVARLERLCADLGQERSTEQHETSRVEALRPLRDPPLLEETADAERLCRSISQILGKLAADMAIAGVLQDLPTAPEIQDTQNLKSMIEAVEASLKGVANRSAEVEVLSAVDSPPALIADAGLLTAIEEYERTETLLRSHQDDLGALDRSLHEVHGQIAQWTQDHPTCPTCGGAIEVERLLVGAEDHNHG